MHINRIISVPPAAVLAWVASACAGAGITVTELQVQLTNRPVKVTVIDVRTPALFTRSHIPGAINIPASLCAQKNLPPLGRVVVCGEGLGRDKTDAAAAALAAKPGISVDVLEGGFAAWESQPTLTTGPGGMQPEAPRYISYAELKAAKPADTLLVDLRRRPAAAPQALGAGATEAGRGPLTDLAQEFPGLRSTLAPFDASRRLAAGPSATLPLLVLIDDGDGAAETIARALRGNGVKRCVILMGGEIILARHGQRGLQRSGSAAHLPNQTPPPARAQ